MPRPRHVLKWTLRIAAVMHATCTATAFASADDRIFPSNEDLRHVRSMSDPRLAPDGRRVLVQIADATADGGRSHLWLVDVAPNTARQLTWSPASDKVGERQGRWLGDGASVLFLAKRAERTELFRLPMAGGEAHAYDLRVVPVVDASTDPDAVPPRKADEPAASHDPLPLEVDSYEPAPDGRAIAIIAKDPETPGEKKHKDDKADALWRDHDPHGRRLYLLDVGSGKLTPVTVPPDVASVAWARQSDRLIAITEGPNNAADLGPARTAWFVDTAKPGAPSVLKELPATILGGAWSDDGARFYFRAQSPQDTPPGYASLFVLGLADGSVRALTPDFAGSLGQENPIPVDRNVLQSAQLGVRRGYVRSGIGRADTLRFDSPVVSGLHCAAKHGACVWLGQSGAQPPALYYARQPGGAAQLLKTPSLLPGNWPPVVPRVVRWSSDGLAIEGLLYLPPQASRGKVPLVVEVHGGPTGAWLDAFNPMAQFLLGQGWAVLRPNPRGSTGYGTAFVAANKNDLGGGDYRDIMAGVDAVIAQYPIDPAKLALAGYSYGGEMAGFVEGRTDRFKAIVSAAPVIDQQSEYGTEADSWYDRWFYGKPWEHAEDAWRQSPLAMVARAKTPFLLIQGEGDTVDPLGQSLEMYRALRQAGVHVEMVQYPRDNHGPLAASLSGLPSTEPWHGFDARQRLVKFIKAAFDKGGGD